jgi:hypothetical protein
MPSTLRCIIILCTTKKENNTDNYNSKVAHIGRYSYFTVFKMQKKMPIRGSFPNFSIYTLSNLSIDIILLPNIKKEHHCLLVAFFVLKYILGILPPQ